MKNSLLLGLQAMFLSLPSTAFRKSIAVVAILGLFLSPAQVRAQSKKAAAEVPEILEAHRAAARAQAERQRAAAAEAQRQRAAARAQAERQRAAAAEAQRQRAAARAQAESQRLAQQQAYANQQAYAAGQEQIFMATISRAILEGRCEDAKMAALNQSRLDLADQAMRICKPSVKKPASPPSQPTAATTNVSATNVTSDPSYFSYDLPRPDGGRTCRYRNGGERTVAAGYVCPPFF